MVTASEPLPVCKQMCGTCPFREGSPYSHLKDMLTISAMTEASRICHCTGEDNAINMKTGVPAHACRGARDVQIQMLYTMQFLDAPTDAAWDRKLQEMKISG